jgi:hypothetical protein
MNRNLSAKISDVLRSSGMFFTFSIAAGGIALYWNIDGQFSDIRGFYGIHFLDRQNDWPLAYHQVNSEGGLTNPIEYPPITALIIWIFSFFAGSSDQPWLQYFRITAIFNMILLAFSAQYLIKLSGKKFALLFLISPAVLYSLNRNWDIWAILPMGMALYLFEKEKYKASSLWLSISVATKFFPLILLIPIIIYFVRKDEKRKAFSYLFSFAIFWTVINLPFALIDFTGWVYFFKFNALRDVGSASIFEILNLLGLLQSNQKPLYYLLNIMIFIALIVFLSKSENILKPSEAAFLTLFVFMFFNKQYSMQYVIWLTYLSILTLSRIGSKNIKYPIYFFACWQITEFLFQYIFFQNVLSDLFASYRGDPSGQFEEAYAVMGLIRYGLISIFLLTLYSGLNRTKEPSNKPTLD